MLVLCGVVATHLRCCFDIAVFGSRSTSHTLGIGFRTIEKAFNFHQALSTASILLSL